jgi:hypothetical protein
MPGDPGGPVVTNSCVYFSHARLRVQWAPGIPHALCGRMEFYNSGRSCRGKETVYPNSFRHSGARVSANPESISPGIVVVPWIPGSMLRIAPE